MNEIHVNAINVSGRYKLITHKSDCNGEIIPNTAKEITPWFDNLITDNGMDMIMSTDTWLSCCRVGNSDIPPSIYDTSLNSHVAGTANIIDSVLTVEALDPYMVRRTNTYRFTVGQINDVIKQVAIGASTEELGDLLSIASIIDEYGMPTAYTITEHDILDVVYEFRYVPSIEDSAGTCSIEGITYTWTLRPANITTDNVSDPAFGWGVNATGTMGAFCGYSVNLYNGALGTITSMPSGESYSVGIVADPYIPNSYASFANISIPTYAGNALDGIKSILLVLGMGAYQIEFSPPIPKTYTDKIDLVVSYSISRN